MKGYSKAEDVKGDEIDVFRKYFLNEIEENTPEEIKKSPILPLDNKKEFIFFLTKDLVEKYALRDWFLNYKKVAMASVAGIRGMQNPVYYWDHRFPLHQMGVALATLGKARVLKKRFPDRVIHKLAAGEVRYHTEEYIEIISRIQAAEGIVTHRPVGDAKTSIWLSSFLIFIEDFDGGEYVTSSHSMSSVIATKDLNNEGSQFLPAESMEFVAEIDAMLKIAETSEEGFPMKFSARDDSNIVFDVKGKNRYVEYLKKGVAPEGSIRKIQEMEKKGLRMMYDVMGGCMFPVMSGVLKGLGIESVFDWHNVEHDPFFHGIGKMFREEDGKKVYYDYGCDASVLMIVETMGYEKLLCDKPEGYVVLNADPDGDRLVVLQVEPASRKKKLDELGITYMDMGEKVLTVYTPNQSFLLALDFHRKQLEREEVFEKHPRFMIKTTPSALAWDEWAASFGIRVLNVPVGFKEIATVMKFVERRMKEDVSKDVVVKDVFGREVNLGKDPRLVFAGEESGGMVTGPEKLIVSGKKRAAISMREKSAGEGSVLMAGLVAELFESGKVFLSDALERLFVERKISGKFDLRKDLVLYNQAEFDPKRLRESMKEGEKLRDRIDSFFLSLAFSLKQGKASLELVKGVLAERFPSLSFDDLVDVVFVGDGSYLKFENKYIEMRPSGTEAKFRVYGSGNDLEDIKRFLDCFAVFDGSLPSSYFDVVDKALYEGVQKQAEKVYLDYLVGMNR